MAKKPTPQLPGLIDSHNHVYSEEFDADLEEVLSRARSAGIVQMVLPCCDSASWPRIEALSQRFPESIYRTVGLHPTYVKEDWQQELTQLAGYLDDPQLVAVGEIGLDYHWDMTYQVEQIEAFERQLHWAADRSLPVILHVREAFADAAECLRRVGRPELRGVFHSFTGSRQELAEALSFSNFYVGINGVVTFKNSDLDSYVTDIPLERLLIETDAPYLAPVPQRGKRNEPAFVAYTAEYLAECYEVPTEELVRITSSNARRLFALPESSAPNEQKTNDQ